MKRITRRLLALLYIGVLFVCVIVAVKPGASIFYTKQTIKKQAITPDAGYAYRLELKADPFPFRTMGVLLYENGNQLNRSDSNIVVESGNGCYALSEPSYGTVFIYFSSSDNSNPITNGRKYVLYLPMSFISQPLGIFYVLILLPGIAWFLLFALMVQEHRRIILHAPNGIVLIFDRFVEHISQIIRSYTGPVRQVIQARAVDWKNLFTITILAATLYIFMEWLFFVTKPSFMGMMRFPEKVEILVFSGLFFSLVCLAAIAIYICLDLLLKIVHYSVISRYLGAAIPTTILSTLALLMIDNFTYTLFKFGISTSEGIWRGAYGLLFICMFLYFYNQVLGMSGHKGNAASGVQPLNWLFYLAMIILVISTGLALTRMNWGILTRADSIENQQATSYPNIILLGSDGVNADNMSVYGYERDTTPRIQELAQSSLVAENAFPNSSNSAGSIVSIFTSKLPTQTRVLYAPDILTGTNAYQHLPGLLKLEGYRTLEFGVPDYVDAFNLNVQYGFDVVNGRTKDYGKTSALIRTLGYDNAYYFLNKSMERASDRIQHIFYTRDIQNPYEIVTQPVRSTSDDQKVTQMLEEIEKSQDPIFVHVHLLGTHGAMFAPPVQVYSKGEQQDQGWMVDFYDDAILSFDHYVGEVIDRLKADGEYENTILIIYSDHAMGYRVNVRIPLIIHFPGDSYSGRVTPNVQNMDIAPTILDYMGIPAPAWMSGRSILNGDLDPHRLIFGAGTVKVAEDEKGLFTLDPQQVKPPFFQFSMMDIVDCQRWYQLDLSTLTWSSGDILGHTAPCSEDNMLTLDEIKQAMNTRLTLDGFDTSSLP